jgi:hypothetical protein
MRTTAALAVALLVSACSGVEPRVPLAQGANEMQPRPGLFSGPTGEFVLVGSPEVPPDGGVGG